MVIHKKRSISVCLSAILLFLTFLSGLALSIPRTMAIHEPAPATDIVDVININVPVSCSMSATGTDSHTANVNNGQTTENIGTTNLKVICNDNSGYAIYAIGYTDDTYGKTVLTSSTLGSTHDIITASTVTTGTSSWAMKLASVSGTYAPIIAGSTGDSLKVTGDPDFSDYTAVPEEYTKVAYHTASTDIGTNATGSNLTTTYRAYISPSQPAGTYVGQVKYTLVHPADTRRPGIPVNRQIEVTYDVSGRGYFDGDSSITTNVVTYDVDCERDNREYYVSHTSNVNDNGNKLSSLSATEHVEEPFSIPGASKLKVVVDYDFAFNEGYNYAENGALYVCYDEACQELYGTGTRTFITNENNVIIYFFIDEDATIDSTHDYGYFARIYPLDENDEEYTLTEYFNCSWTNVNGEYKMPFISGNGCWLRRWEATFNNRLSPYEHELMPEVIQNLMLTNNNQIILQAQAAC